MTNAVQKRFDNPSKLFIWLFSVGNFLRGGSYYNELLQEMNLSGTETILEFGSGVGSLAKRIASKLYPLGYITCVDVSEKLLTYTKGKLKKFPNTDYFLGDIRNSNLVNNKYDIIVSTWVLHHVDRPILASTIAKFSDLLKGQGKIYIIEFPDSKYNHTKLKQSELLDLFTLSNFKYKILFIKKQGILYQFTK